MNSEQAELKPVSEINPQQEPPRSHWRKYVILGLSIVVAGALAYVARAAYMHHKTLRADPAVHQHPSVEIVGSAKSQTLLPAKLTPTFYVEFNKEFKLGDCSYVITRVIVADALRNGRGEITEAPHGSRFIEVGYQIRNDKTESIQWKGTTMRLIAHDGRQYLNDTYANERSTTLPRLRQLHPGVIVSTHKLFLVPEDVARGEFAMYLQNQTAEPGTWAALPLAAGVAPMQTRAKPKTARTSRHESFAPGNPQYEEMRREILLNRPPGTSSTDYDPDWH